MCSIIFYFQGEKSTILIYVSPLNPGQTTAGPTTAFPGFEVRTFQGPTTDA